MTDNCLLSSCILRRATVEDIWTICRLVLSAKLDFTQLRWQQFWLIEQEGKVADFYSYYGFEVVTWQELPRSLKLKFGISQVAKTVLRLPVAFMYYQKSNHSIENQ